MALTGRIIEEQRNYFVIDTARGVFQARLRGTMRTKRPCVGDIVSAEIINLDSSEAQIHAIAPRRNFIPRPPLANMDQCIIVASLVEPVLNLEQLDRFCFFTEAYDCSALIAFNKIDLLSTTQLTRLKEVRGIYEAAGYRTLEISAKANKNLGIIAENCTGKYSFLAGESGVGKTALLAALFPDRSFRTAELSQQTRRGVHTTTSIHLLKLPNNGFIADTPGFSNIELPLVPETLVISYFPDLTSTACRFNNCMHENEPGCDIKERVENGSIASSRYEHYIKIYREMKQQNAPALNLRARER